MQCGSRNTQRSADSRQIPPPELLIVTIGWPFFVLGAVLVMENRHTKASLKYVFVVLIILYRQFWLKLNSTPRSQEIYGDLLEFPPQLYFMHYDLCTCDLTY